MDHTAIDKEALWINKEALWINKDALWEAFRQEVGTKNASKDFKLLVFVSRERFNKAIDRYQENMKNVSQGQQTQVQVSLPKDVESFIQRMAKGMNTRTTALNLLHRYGIKERSIRGGV